ncbi:MAG: hypothetical protein AAF554_04165 [Bacteroidota bacterium]
MRIVLLKLLFIASFLQGFCQVSKEAFSSTEIWENVHLHLNKTTFLEGERLWFKAYVREQKSQLPSLSTSNLHIALYDLDGKQIKRKLVYVRNGMGEGYIPIDSTFVNEKYTLLAWTNYMRNFKNLEPYRQEIQIVKYIDEVVDDTEEYLEIKAYPEGGYLIEGAYNAIGIRLQNKSGQGVLSANIELVDDTGKVIQSNIKTNSFGIGQTGFMVESNKTYRFLMKRPGLSTLEAKLPMAVTDRFGFNINNNGKDKILVKLVGSEETFTASEGQECTMAIYQNAFTYFEDVELDKDKAVVSVPREKLPHGVLTAVLFDQDLNPIAQRMFFNHSAKGPIVEDLEVEHCPSFFGDSIQVDLILPKRTLQQINMSVSALPPESIAYAPNHSVMSSFLLRPYVNKPLEDYYFFDAQDRRKRFELDKRLLIEGWGRYDWQSKNSRAAKIEFAFENGISFGGKVPDADVRTENQLSLVAEESSAIDFAQLDSRKSFEGNMVLFEKDSLMLSLLGEKGKLRKPNATVEFKSNQEFVKEIPEWLKDKTEKREHIWREAVAVDQTLNLGERTIVLEGVTLTRAARAKKVTFVTTGSKGLISEGRIIGDAEIKRYSSVLNYLAILGYKPSRGVDADGFYYDTLLSPRSNTPVNLIGSLNIPLSNVSAIYFDIEKKNYVQIVPRAEAYVRPENRIKYLKFLIKEGYVKPEAYFTPNYPSYSNRVFKNYGALDWKGNVTVGADVPTSILLPINSQNEILLHMEGMGSDGSLISEAVKIKVN